MKLNDVERKNKKLKKAFFPHGKKPWEKEKEVVL